MRAREEAIRLMIPAVEFALLLSALVLGAIAVKRATFSLVVILLDRRSTRVRRR